jgi:hypothetical protein
VSRACRRLRNMRGLAFATRRGTAAPLHTSFARRSHARSDVCAPSVYGSGAGLCNATSRRGRGCRHAHRAPPHIRRRRAHIGLFRNRRSLAERWRVLLVSVRSRVPARVCRRVRVLRRWREPTEASSWFGKGGVRGCSSTRWRDMEREQERRAGGRGEHMDEEKVEGEDAKRSDELAPAILEHGKDARRR